MLELTGRRPLGGVFWVFESDKSDITGFLRCFWDGACWERGQALRLNEINRDGATSRRRPGGDDEIGARGPPRDGEMRRADVARAGMTGPARTLMS